MTRDSATDFPLDVKDDVVETSNDIVENSVKPMKMNYCMKELESVQYQAALAVTGVRKCSTRVKVYNELGWECPHDRRSFKRIT